MKVITTAEFEATIKSGFTVVDFYADWCGPCKLLSPILEEILEENSDKLNAVKVNVDNDPDLAGQFGVMSIPNLVFFKDGQMVGRSIGLMGKEDLLARIEAAM